MKMLFRNFVLLLSVTLLSGCIGRDMQDLQNWTENLYKGQVPDVERLPVIPPYESFVYTASEKVDPFSESNMRRRQSNKSNITGGPQPIENRRREPLEQYPLDSLAMVGTLQKQESSWVILRAPDETIHRARMGNYIGQSHGLITTISEEKVNVRELVQDSNGNWLERKAMIAINQ